MKYLNFQYRIVYVKYILICSIITKLNHLESNIAGMPIPNPMTKATKIMKTNSSFPSFA